MPTPVITKSKIVARDTNDRVSTSRLGGRGTVYPPAKRARRSALRRCHGLYHRPISPRQ
jgi:hypothetical protein